MAGFKKLCPFKSTRKILLTKLQTTSHILHENPSQIHTIPAAHLTELITLTETLHADGEFEERITDVALPLCFRPRCKQIKRELEWTKTVLDSNPNPSLASYAVVVLDMLALQVGRLVVDGNSDEDGFTAEMEMRIHDYDDGLRGRARLVDEDAELRERQMEEIWGRLNGAFEGCGCFQCAWRFRG